jgi:hypothetical protein
MPERGLVNDLTITNTSASRPDFISISGSAENASRLQREIRETLQADPASNALKSPIPLHWDSVCEPHSAEEGLRDAITLTRQYLADDVLGESLDSMALASFSDCGTGAYLVDTWGVQQPSSHAYRMMDALGDEMIAAGSNWILTRDMLGRMIALAWYDPDAPANLTIDCMRPYSRVMIETIDRSHGWAYNTWRQMGMPESLTRCQVQALRQAALNTCVAWSRTNEEGSFTLTLPSLESLILVKEQ